MVSCTIGDGALQRQAESLSYSLESSIWNDKPLHVTLSLDMQILSWPLVIFYQWRNNPNMETTTGIQRKWVQWRCALWPSLSQSQMHPSGQVYMCLSVDRYHFAIVLACRNVVTNNNYENPLSCEMLTFNRHSQHQSVLCKQTVMRTNSLNTR